MIYIVYTTKTKKQHVFDLSNGILDLWYALKKSSTARSAWDGDKFPSVSALINNGVNILLEATTPADEAFIKIIPYDKEIPDISFIYRRWQTIKGVNPSIYQIIEANLISGKYKNVFEMFNDIGEEYKNSAVSMVSFYSPIEGKLYPYGYYSDKVTQEVLYENIERIETAIQNEYAFSCTPFHIIGTHYSSSIVFAEFHADLAKRCPLVRLDVYFNRELMQHELDEFKAINLSDRLSMIVTTSLPGYESEIRIECTSVLTEAEVNKKHYGL